jgi:hypothetical protein
LNPISVFGFKPFFGCWNSRKQAVFGCWHGPRFVAGRNPGANWNLA